MSSRRLIPTLAARLRELRRLSGLVQERLAVKIGASQASICLAEGGTRGVSLELAARIAWGLGVDVGCLLEPEGAPVRPWREGSYGAAVEPEGDARPAWWGKGVGE